MNKKDIETPTPIPWKLMTFYQKFEQAVVVTLSGVISFIIIISLFQLIQTVYSLSLNSGFHPMNHQAFQSMFGMIMTLLIAMEFKHSIIRTYSDPLATGSFGTARPDLRLRITAAK